MSKDSHTNNNGFRLLDMCKNNNLFITNGRLDRDMLVGDYTFPKKSVLDYTLVSVESFGFLKNFEVVETDAFFSDGHSILSHSLFFHTPVDKFMSESKCESNGTKHAKWNENKVDEFCSNINLDDVNSILNCLNCDAPSQLMVNEVTQNISNIFSKACERTFPIRNRANNRKPVYKKPWFGPICQTARKKYHLARKRFNKCKNAYNRNLMTESSKHYKKYYE